MFQRLKFVQSFVHELEGAAGTLTYRAGEYYHVAEEHVKALVDKGIAILEGSEAEAKAEAEKVDAAAVENAKGFIADLQAKKDNPNTNTGGVVTESGGSVPAAPPEAAAS